MAKLVLSGLIQNIRGSIGDIVFSSMHGRHYIRRKPKHYNDSNSKRQKEIRKNLAYLSRKWNLIPLKDKILWELYAKKFKYRKKTPISSVIVADTRRPVNGRNAFISVNQLLLCSGLNEVQKPPLKEDKSPFPQTDIINHHTYTDAKIKFNIWIQEEHLISTFAQIWIAKSGNDCLPQIAITTPISNQKNEILIDKIRLRNRQRFGRKWRVKEVNLRKIAPSVFRIQMRTINQEGGLSLPSAIYKIEVTK